MHKVGEIRDNVKKNLGYYLSLKKISQKQLAEKLRVSQSAVTNWIKGKNSPDIEAVAQICNILEISVTDLFGVAPAALNPIAERAAASFKNLNPDYQEFILEQIEKLLELQVKMNRSGI